ncbi:MAG: RICIN domain-containing protein [Saccharofermentans sp.]|nr:RICIN domain-containing protein [Saccharofermentans sp.]
MEKQTPFKRTVSFLLTLALTLSVLIISPLGSKKVNADTQLQQAIASIGNSANNTWTIDNVPDGHPNNWCGDYANRVLQLAYQQCGYNNYWDYYCSSDMPGATRIAKTVPNDTRWAAYYSWSNWSFTVDNETRVGQKTSNRNSYEPQIGDIVTVAWDDESNASDPDHVGIIIGVNSNGSISVSEGNTGSYAPYVHTFTYTKQTINLSRNPSFNGESCYRRGGGTIVCIVRPYDPTAITPGAQWTEYDDFYAYLIVMNDKDGNSAWKHLASEGSDNNVQIASGGNQNTSDAQIWRFVRQSNNNYVIYNCKDGSCMDAYGAGTDNGTNVYTYKEYVGGSNQQWTIYRNGDGFSIKAAHCSKFLDCNGGYTTAGTNVQLWEYNGSNAQKFSIYCIAKKTTALPSGHVYLIQYNDWKHFENNNNNAQIAAGGNDSFDPKQIWYINKNSDGTYSFNNAYNDGTSMSLDATNSGKTAGTNVGVYKTNSGSNQKWVIYERNGEYGPGYIIRASYCDLVLDVTGGTAAAGTNIELWKANNTAAQTIQVYYLSHDNHTYSRPGAPAAPTLTAPASAIVNQSISLSWTASALKDEHYDKRSYTVEVLNSSGTVVNTYSTTSLSKSITISSTGTYTLRVRAVNTKYPGNCISTLSNSVKITVNPATKDISGLTFTGIASQTYTGSEIKPSVTIKDGSKTLVSGTDYTLAYSNNINKGTATVTITGKGSYTGSKKMTFAINARDIASATASTVAAQTYTGTAQTPGVTLTYNGKTLVKDTDYTVAYSSNITAGTATITVTGKGNFTGTKKVTFAINARSISDAAASTVSSQVYSGSAHTPDLTLTYGGKTLVKNTDYTVAYSNNINAGTATITITGKGNFTGTKTVTFTISGKNISVASASSIPAQTYTGSEFTPSFTVKDGSKLLEEDTDYTVEYSDNINAGTATITITGTGNYAGTKEITFDIKACPLSEVTASEITNRQFDNVAITPGCSLTFNGKRLVSTKDYTVAYSDNFNAGTATVTITGKGNFTGTKTLEFTIEPRPMGAVEVSQPENEPYTGGQIKPSVTVRDRDKILVYGVDYTLGYSDNVNIGPGTVSVIGIGNYTGNKDAHFTIYSTDINDVTVSPIYTQRFTGYEVTPGVKLTFKGRTLIKDTDYKLIYRDNVNIGTAKIDVIGLGNFYGSFILSFEIAYEVEPGWREEAGVWYYLDEAGIPALFWQKIDGLWYYFNEKGEMMTYWQLIDGEWYYFCGSGYMVKHWQKIGGTWYYFGENGSMRTGWQKINNLWYYFSASGAMQTGWQLINDKWYYLESDGHMITGWRKSGVDWYYFKDTGEMKTGWHNSSGTWYYLDETGCMAYDVELSIDGKVYYFDQDGRCTNPY